MSNLIRQNLIEAKEKLEAFISDNVAMAAVEEAANVLIAAFKDGKKVISCGNGGSMCDAMHFAEELTGRFRNDRPPIAAISISDPSHMTCVGNDYGFDEVFSRYVQAVGVEGDVLLAISTSGNSSNVIKAVKVAKQKKMNVIGLTGKDGGALAELCDVEVRAPYSDYADRVQEIHIKVIHSLIHYIEEHLS